MLIHKSTMGVLQTYWTGTHRVVPGSTVPEPVMKEYTFRNAPELSPEEWWEVPMSSKLGKKIRMYYPWITPVVDETRELTDVEIQREALDGEQETRKAALAQEAQRRGYQQRKKVRPKNIMPFLAAKGEKT